MCVRLCSGVCGWTWVCMCMYMGVHMCKGKGLLPVRLTVVSWANSICSDRPMSSTSGLCATHSSLSETSAAARCTLSADCRPWSRPASAVWTSAGSTDMVVCGRCIVYRIPCVL